MKYHFDKETGWLGGPCGLTFYKGRYHVFYQYYPHAKRYGTMHWGHLVSDDLISWEELPAALEPDNEDKGYGCSSGCAITTGDEIYLYYGSVSDKGESISLATSSDGLIFEKKGLILEADEGYKFRTPFVFEYEGSYRMLVGSGYQNVAKILMYKSDDLINWTSAGEILSDARFGSVIEYPQLIRDKDKWILVIQSIRHLPVNVLFAAGSFDGESFTFDIEDGAERFTAVETGPEFFAPVSCGNILIAWLFSKRYGYASSFTAPRTLSIGPDGRPVMHLVKELEDKLISESRFVRYENGRLEIFFGNKMLWSKAYAHAPEIKVLEDVGTVEIFMEDGSENVSLFIC